MRQLKLGLGTAEKLGVLGVGTGPATLDEADAELVELPRDEQLVQDRQGQALALGAVAQRRVVDVELVVHLWSNLTQQKTPRAEARRGGRGPQQRDAPIR